MAELDARRAEVLGRAARTIQRQIRTHIARKEFIMLRKAAIQLQSLWRGTLVLKNISIWCPYKWAFRGSFYFSGQIFCIRADVFFFFFSSFVHFPPIVSCKP